MSRFRAAALLAFAGTAVGVAPGTPWHFAEAAEPPGCTASVSADGTYGLTVCITAPAPNNVLSGTRTVTATTKITQQGTSVRMNNVAFCLDVDGCDAHPSPETYVLTDYAAEAISSDGTRTYSFLFDSTQFADGPHTLYVVPVTNRETLSSATISMTFQNGSNGPPPRPTGFVPRSGSVPSGGTPFTFAVAGDGAGGEPNQTNVANLIAGWQPNMFLYLGDVYQKGTIAEFDNHYDAGGFGQFASITNPAIGNHEYSADPGADGYFRYWESPPDHYSVDAGGWHVISLNSTSQYDDSSSLSQNSKSNPDPNSQYNWLKADLEANAGSCTVVTYHHPVFNSGSQSKVGFDPNSTNGNYFQDIWELLADHDVSVVLNGHVHNYQRFVPIGRDGVPDPTGVTQITVGGGGHALSSPAIAHPTDGAMLAAIGSFYGAIRLSAYPDRMDFSMLNANTGQLFDQGSIPCQGLGPDTTPPAPLASLNVTGTTTNTGHPNIELAWTLADVPDDRGVASLVIRRSDSNDVLATVPGNALGWADDSVQIGVGYSYSVTATDAWANESSPVVSQVVSAPAATTTNVTIADTYVNSTWPVNTYGTATKLRVGNSSSSTTISYFKFDLTREQPVIASAILRVLPTSSSASATVTPHVVADQSWTEAREGPGRTSWSNAPPLGAGGPAVQGFTSDSWVSFDVTSLVTGNDVVTIALSEDIPGTAMSFNSREANGAVAAELIVTSAQPPDTTPPTTPTGVVASAPTDAEAPVTVTWNPSVDDSGAIDQYVVLRDSLEVGAVAAESYTDFGVDAATTYSYQIIAVDGAGNESSPSAPSAAATVTTLDTTAPDAPEAASVIALSQTSALVAWEGAHDNVAVGGYEILRRPAGGSQLAVVATRGPSAREWIDESLDPGTAYDFAIRTLDTSGNRSENRFVGTITTPDGSTDETPPGTPPDLVAIASSGSTVDLTWGAATDDVGVVGYVLLRDGIVVAPGPSGVSTSFGDTGLTSASTYVYTVYAQDAAGNLSSEPATVAVDTPDDVAPSVPTSLALSENTLDHVSLSWSAASDNVGVAGYVVSAGGVDIGSSASNALTILTQPSTTYTFDVRAFDAAGNTSARSSPLTVTTPSPEQPVERAAPTIADTYVKNGAFADNNYGLATLMRVQGGATIQNAYLLFSVDADTARSNVERSVLKLYAQGAQPSVSVSLVPNTMWSERAVTFNTAPVIGTTIGTLPATTTGGWVELDVSAYVRAPGMYAFAVTISSTSVPKFSTKEWSAANPSAPPQTPVLAITSNN